MSTPIAFVAGATGLTGRSVVDCLRARTVVTHAHVRPDSSQLERWRSRFDECGATLDQTAWTLEAMTATFARVRPTHVFALLGTTKRRMRSEGGDYRAIDYGLTALLIDALLAAEVSARFVYLSAAGVNPKTSNAYLKARADLEAKLKASGLPWVIARPSFILGDRDANRPMESVGASVADGLLSVGKLLGMRKAAERYRSTPAPVLAHALVTHGLDGDAGALIEGAALRLTAD